MAAGSGGAVASGGGSGRRGGVSQPPATSSARAVVPRDSVAAVASAVAVTTIKTLCMFGRHPHLPNRPGAYDKPAGLRILLIRQVAGPRGDR